MSLLFRSRASFFVIFMTLLFMGTYFLVMNRAQRSTINTLIVEETKTQFDNLKKNFDDAEERRLVVDEEFVDEFDLEEGEGQLHPRQQQQQLYVLDGRPNVVDRRREPEAVVTAVKRGDAGQAVHFVRNVLVFMPEANIVLHDLGLSYYEVDLVTKYCNSTSCAVKKFDVDPYPGHVDRLGLSASRPLIIRKCLQNFSSVLWLDVSQRLTSRDLEPYLERGRKSGIVTWFRIPSASSEEDGEDDDDDDDDEGEDNFKRRHKLSFMPLPTSALTHPKMFTRLGVFRSEQLEEYHFQHMVGLDALLVYNTRAVSEEVMAPWVKCALINDCIEPVGAQSSGCRMDKKPPFRYSGCHDYDVSALNVLLGRHFEFREGDYVSQPRFFTRMSEDLEADIEEEEEKEEERERGEGYDRSRHSYDTEYSTLMNPTLKKKRLRKAERSNL